MEEVENMVSDVAYNVYLENIRENKKTNKDSKEKKWVAEFKFDDGITVHKLKLTSTEEISLPLGELFTVVFKCEQTKLTELKEVTLSGKHLKKLKKIKGDLE